MILYDVNQPDIAPYVYGITVFDAASGVYIHPLRWRTFVITWNASNLTWEAAF